jgi:hypothetical protein
MTTRARIKELRTRILAALRAGPISTADLFPKVKADSGNQLSNILQTLKGDGFVSHDKASGGWVLSRSGQQEAGSATLLATLPAPAAKASGEIVKRDPEASTAARQEINLGNGWVEPAPQPSKEKQSISLWEETEASMQDAAEQARRALDDYLASVIDPAIVGPLQSALDNSLLALSNFRRTKAA